MPDEPIVREVEGFLEIEWPDPRPEQFPISAGLFEQLINQENQRRSLIGPRRYFLEEHSPDGIWIRLTVRTIETGRVVMFQEFLAAEAIA